MDSWWLFLAVGFVAQLVDGALGMAYGVLTMRARRAARAKAAPDRFP